MARDILSVFGSIALFVWNKQQQMCCAGGAGAGGGGTAATATTKDHADTTTTCDAPVVTGTTTTTKQDDDTNNNNNNRLLNSAFVFVKPHANTVATQNLVRDTLISKGIRIVSENDINGQIIDDKRLIDRHYYAIASKATIMSPMDIPVPVDIFQEKFHESWDVVLKENRACNAMEACERFHCTPDELNIIWNDEKYTKVIKLGGGFYCGLVTYKEQSLYVFNAFFMSMRSRFVGKEKSIYYFVIEWDPIITNISWEDFRSNILGPTNPIDAPEGSLRNRIYNTYKELGMKTPPNKSDNGVHGSASPFEGLVEKMNWLGIELESDIFGNKLLNSGIDKRTIEEWSIDPHIIITKENKTKKKNDESNNNDDDDDEDDNNGESTTTTTTMGSIFDALEDHNVDDCLNKMIQLYAMNSKKSGGGE